MAAAAALGEARGVRVVPQIRRQVPERWRRVMPLPLAAMLYGVLLGLGFTTFVLTLATWALAAISLALGDPIAGGVIGLSFGAGRALPVVLIAPLIDGSLGARLAAAMAERPALLRGFRRADALALGVCAVLLPGGEAPAATTAVSGFDPTVAGTALAWQEPGASGMLQANGQTTRLPGQEPALGGPFLAWRTGEQVTIAQRDTLATVAQVAIPGVDKLAISRDWLVYRAMQPGGRDSLLARPLANLADARLLAGAAPPTQIGRPSLDGDVVVFHLAERRQSRIVQINLKTGGQRTLRRSRLYQLLNPSVRNRSLLYVSLSRCSQKLLLGHRSRRARDRVLLQIPGAARRDRGYERGHTRQGRSPGYCHLRRSRARAGKTLWTTALAGRMAYITRLESAGGATRAQILRLRR